MRTNAHAHLLPEPNQIPVFMKTKKLFWIDAERKFMHQGTWQRPITHASFFLDNRLEWLEQQHIDHEVIITLSQLYANGLNRADALAICQFQNDFHAEIQADNAGKFTCGFVVQPAFIDDALHEAERAISLRLNVLCLPSHYLNQKGEWLSIADESVDPIWALAHKHSLAVEIHPYGTAEIVKLANKNWRFHLIWMCAQTADAFHEFTLRALYRKYANVRSCWAHGNQVGAVAQGRREQGFKGRPDLFKGKESPAKALGAKNIYVDTLVHDTLSLNLLAKRFGVNQMVAGLDNPYPLGEMDGVGNGYPGKVIDDAVEQWIISKKEGEQMWNENVKNWLGK